MSASIEEIVRSPAEGISRVFSTLKSYIPTNDQNITWQYTDSSRELSPKMTGRQELVAKLVSTCLGLAVSFTITYFGFKYLANVLDPTRQEKKEAQKRVMN